eukprot:3241195-Lingulodinium_polyedra.AAC.1
MPRRGQPGAGPSKGPSTGGWKTVSVRCPKRARQSGQWRSLQPPPPARWVWSEATSSGAVLRSTRSWK